MLPIPPAAAAAVRIPEVKPWRSWPLHSEAVSTGWYSQSAVLWVERKHLATREDLHAIERLADGYRAPHRPLSGSALQAGPLWVFRLKFRGVSPVRSSKRIGNNQDLPRIIFPDASRLVSQ